MWRGWLLLTAAVVCLSGLSAALEFLSAGDVERLKTVLSPADTKPADISIAHYKVVGTQLLGGKLTDQQKKEFCAFAEAKLDQTSVASLYHASAIDEALACKLKADKAQAAVDAEFASDKATTQTVYFAAAAATHFGAKLDQAKLKTALTAALKRDDSAGSLGYSFQAATYLKTEQEQFFSRVEDLVGQADEVDGKYLQFEGGLSVTALSVAGAYMLAEKLQKAPSIKADECVKFTEYMLSRRGTQLPRAAFHLARTLTLLTTNKFHVPVSTTLASPVAVTAAAPKVTVRLCDVLGKSVGALAVTLDSATHAQSSGVVLSRKAMTKQSGDTSQTLYDLNLLEERREKGFYALSVSGASASDKRLVGTQGAVVRVKVMTEIAVADADIAVSDREQTATANVHKLTPGAASKLTLEADTHQKLVMRFKFVEKADKKPIGVHQAFVIFEHEQSKQEVIFVAESDASLAYKFDVDFLKAVKDFDNLSGKYKMRLVAGDAVVSNPIDWPVAVISLTFPARVEKAPSADDVSYEKKAEIRHLFREPDKRPPEALSMVFTGLCLAPLLVLFVAWLSIGVNMSNFSFSIFTIGFHLGLSGIFGLYFVFWLQLNMFQTVKYLIGIAGFTFLCGNSMLRRMAERRKSKAD